MSHLSLSKSIAFVIGALGAGLLSIAPATAEAPLALHTADKQTSDDPMLEDSPVIDEEPAPDAPVLDEEPVLEEEPILDEAPVLEEDPALEEDPVLDEPVIDEDPALDEPVIDEDPVLDEPAIEEPVLEDPAPAEPMLEDPVPAEPIGPDTSASTIVDVASGSGSFNTLVQAIGAADLASTLSGPGPYTVFAPTDAAFASLPEGALDFLLQPENKDLLTEVLTYHVVPGEIMASELTTGGIDALSGGLAVGVFDSGVVINNGSVTQADIQASNGVIHQVNRVLIPSALQQQLAAQLGVRSLYQ